MGDYVVHAEHGIGRYLGLEKKALGQTKFEEMRGVQSVSVEVLVVEYAGGDRLFLPVTRLHQIQKYAGGESAQPKLDRLGGQPSRPVVRAMPLRIDEVVLESLEGELVSLDGEEATPPGLHQAEGEAPAAREDIYEGKSARSFHVASPPSPGLS